MNCLLLRIIGLMLLLLAAGQAQAQVLACATAATVFCDAFQALE
jgi:hypothetical protein